MLQLLLFLQNVVTVLLQHNADVSVINAEGHTAKALTHDPEIIRLIEGLFGILPNPCF